jgi:hypothetical protein
MREFIEELKYNKKINEEKGLENRVDVDYVIERLEEIDKQLLDNIYYFEYHSKNLTNKQYEKVVDMRENLEDKGVFK